MGPSTAAAAATLLLFALVLTTTPAIQCRAAVIPVNSPSIRPNISIAYGVISSSSKFSGRIKQHIWPWWRNVSGAIYVDKLTEAQEKMVPPGMRVVNHHDLLQQYLPKGAVPHNHFGARGVLMWHDMRQRFPDADWYVGGDDDTFFLTANLEVELLRWDPGEPWYIGGVPVVQSKRSSWGDSAVGGGGIILSRGAMARMAATLPSCAVRWSVPVGDRSIALCVLGHGIPFTPHDGLHYADLWHATLLEHHPHAPFLSLHKHYPGLPAPMKQAMAMHPSGFAQQARCGVSSPSQGELVVSLASGVAVEVWPPSQEYTWFTHLQLPANFTANVTNPPTTPRPAPLARFTIAASTWVGGGGGGGDGAGGKKTLATAYEPDPRAPPAPGLGFGMVVVHEPLWPDRWRRAPLELCCQRHLVVAPAGGGGGGGGGGGVAALHLHMTNEASECVWEGFGSSGGGGGGSGSGGSRGERGPSGSSGASGATQQRPTDRLRR